METRLNPAQADPASFKAMLALEAHIASSGLERNLIELVKTRASQINGCAYCVHMHTRDARAAGESEERLHLLTAWRESPLYTPRERAALAWTEALTLLSQSHAPDGDYDELAAHFEPAEQVRLSLLIGAINIWNRLAVGFRLIHPVEPRAVAAAG